MRIGNLIDCHLTKKFLRYIKAINELERKVRKGQNFLLQMHRLLVDVDDSEEGDQPDEGMGKKERTLHRQKTQLDF